jgi:hypothetical protein
MCESILNTKKRSSRDRTKHIDIKHHFVLKQIENGLVKVIFARSEENLANIFTNHVGGESFKFHKANWGDGTIKGRVLNGTVHI